jgi:hypothetical protein
MANYWFAADYTNIPPQLQESGVPVVRPFTAVVNSAGGSLNGQKKVATLGSSAPDVIALCTLPGQGYGIIVLDFMIEFGIIDSNNSPTLEFELGLLLTSTTNANSTSSLDTGSTSMAAAGYFGTLMIFDTATAGGILRPNVFFSIASTPTSLPWTPVAGALPLMITNQPGGNTGGNVATYPNSGLYDFCLTVTENAATVSATDAYIKGWIMYQTLGAVIQS